MRLNQLIGDRAEAVAKFPGGEVTLGYRPTALTPKLLSSMDRTVAEALSLIVTDWPLETVEGEPIPVTVEGIEEHLPTDVQLVLYGAILESRQGNSERRTNEPPNSETSE